MLQIQKSFPFHHQPESKDIHSTEPPSYKLPLLTANMLSLSIVTLMATVLAGTAAAAPAEVKAVPAKEATAGTSSILAANVQFEVCRAINFNDCGIFLAEEFQCCKRPLVLKVFIKNCLVWSCNRVADAKYRTSQTTSAVPPGTSRSPLSEPGQWASRASSGGKLKFNPHLLLFAGCVLTNDTKRAPALPLARVLGADRSGPTILTKTSALLAGTTMSAPSCVSPAR